jgi:glutathione-specific gamma-glutamylcyclotransferase
MYPKDTMALTPELVALVDRVEPDPGPEPGTTDPTDEQYDQIGRSLLSDRRGEELWVFAYGSLIWKPEFDFVEHRRAIASGWHRSFCLKLTRWRGTREVPALMLALDGGGSCSGICHRLPAEDHIGQLGRLVRREIDGHPATNVPRWIAVRMAEGTMRALAFVVDPKGRSYAGRLPLEEVAYITARAAGHWGSAAQYLQRTVAQLEEHGIRDRNLWRLQALVAAEIEVLQAQRPS